MISYFMFWRMWKALNDERPHRHPYVRLLERQYVPKPRRRSFPPLANIITFALPFVACGLCVVFSNFVAILIFMALLIFYVFFMFGGGNVGGALLGVQVNTLSTFERRRQRDRLMSITPIGKIGTGWLLLYIAYRRSGTTRTIISSIRDILAIAFYFWLVIAVFTVPTALIWRDDVTLTLLGLLITVLIFMFAIYFDSVQSTVMGGLVGMGMAGEKTERSVALVMFIGAFFVMQMVLYISAGFVIQIIYFILPDGVFLSQVALSSGLVSLIVLRDIVIRLIMRRIARIYDEDWEDLSALVKL